jgi:oligogalacturonide lyase
VRLRFILIAIFAVSAANAQMGRRWPSEKKIVPDPVTGLPLTFLTSTDGGYRQSKIYQTHRQWTVDGKWLIFRGTRETGSQAFAVNEQSGEIIQVTETGFSGMLCAGNKTMKLVVMSGGGRGSAGPRQILEIDLAKTVRRRSRRKGEARGKLPAGLRNHSANVDCGREHGARRQRRFCLLPGHRSRNGAALARPDAPARIRPALSAEH